MYTGLVRTMGSVVARETTPSGVRLRIRPDRWPWRAEAGDSIAVSGCCLSLVGEPVPDPAGLTFTFDATPETLSKTTLGTWETGTRINLEPSLAAGDHMGGHQVQGHVDGVGTVLGVEAGDGYRVRIGVPGAFELWLVPKGSVCVDGISLTIAATGGLNTASVDGAGSPWFEVALIPDTLKRTTISQRVAGDRVNLEADILSKTIVHYLQHADIDAVRARAGS